MQGIQTKRKSYRDFLIFISLFFCGFVLRLFLSSITDHTLRWDSLWYHNAALEILEKKFVPDCCNHGMGYPFFLSIIYILFHRSDSNMVFYLQAFLDAFSGLIISSIAYRKVRRDIAFISMVLYQINPFTASYVGFIMTEILSVWIISLLLFLFSTTSVSIKKWVFIMTLLGILALVKPSFILFSFVAVGFFPLLNKKLLAKLKYFFVGVLVLGIVYFFPMLVNKHHFAVFSIGPPYGLSLAAQLYIAPHRPFTEEIFPLFLSEQPLWSHTITAYYNVVETDLSGVSQFNAMFIQKLLHAFFNNPLKYLVTYLNNISLFWDKRHLFMYVDPFYPADTVYLRTVNIILLAASVIGFFSKYRKHLGYLPIFTVVLFCYAGIGFPLISNLTRHSITLYSLVLFWAAIGLYAVYKRLFPLTLRTI